MHSAQKRKTSASGYSLVEIMIGIAIAMIGVLIMTQIWIAFEGQKRTTTSGSDAQISGMTALFTIERDVRRAGYGIGIADAIGCTTKKFFSGGGESTFTLTPVEIAAGSDGGPDTVRLLASSKSSWSVPGRTTAAHNGSTATLSMNTTFGIEDNDFLVLHEAGKPCTMIQVNSGVRTDSSLSYGTAGWPHTASLFPPGGYAAESSIINLGGISNRLYAVTPEGGLVVQDYASLTNADGPRQSVSGDIVSLKAQYGFDARAGAQPEPKVTRWSSVMLDADSNGTTGDAGDARRILAVRIAVVARSPLRERQDQSGTCAITPVAPTWTAADANGNLGQQTITLTHIPQWSCYRYKVFENVVPLRNMIWRAA